MLVKEIQEVLKMPQSGQNKGVTAYISVELRQQLEDWAAEEDRSISWLLGKLIEDALKARQAVKQQQGDRK